MKKKEIKLLNKNKAKIAESYKLKLQKERERLEQELSETKVQRDKLRKTYDKK